ncbi:EAL domain-containing protein [Paraneptunicella aestuarii]|uniref:putative bifunctional diguanylate cyclase/phosphodiesterase n=1 Tax=Paraneptunicella aestuarii TaxID=2831148 RepID=UPI001E2E0FC3|nr:GGDEF domain-containing response regulator [Paraneptunicella aestuarii]UAA38620.1 EAL domain-containing protein [Paraneptunicella aestuarii]
MKILIVDDDLVDREHIKRILRSDDPAHEFVEAHSLEQGLSYLKQDTFDLVLLDYRMPPGDGVLLLDELRKPPMKNETPIVMLSNSEDIELSQECIRKGAQDFLVKGNISVAALKRAIAHAKTRFEEEKVQHQHFVETKKIAERDSLTGLANRYLFEQAYAIYRSNAKRKDTQIAIIMFDLDHFKQINDSCGHAVGDEVLKHVAKRVQKVIRGSEVFARLGGDEFVILLSGKSSGNEASNLARRIVKSLSEPFDVGKRRVNATASVGIATDLEGHDDLDNIMRHADIALYRAKRTGRNQVCFFQQDMQVEFEKSSVMEIILKEALYNQQIDVHFQPVQHLANRNIAGYEGLMRLHKSDQILEAKEFINFAEETGLIWEIGRWSIEMAIATLPNLQTRASIQFISINLSTHQLVDETLYDHICYCLRTYEVDASHVVFEIDEKALLQGGGRRRQCLQSIADLGCRLALDNFGAGVSAISCLTDFPISLVKTSPHLIQSNLKRDRVKLKGIVQMLHTLNIETVIKGIETEEQHKFAEELAVEYVQGYYYGKPKPIALGSMDVK